MQSSVEYFSKFPHTLPFSLLTNTISVLRLNRHHCHYLYYGD